MNDVISQLPTFSTFPIILLSAVIAMILPLSKRNKFLLMGFLYILLGILLMIAYSILLIHITPYQATYSPESPLIGTLAWCLLMFLLMTGFSYATCKISLTEAIYASCCGYLAEHMTYCLRNLLSTVIDIPVGHVSYWILIIACYASFYHLFAKRIVHHGHYTKSAIGSLRLSITILTVVVVMSAFATSHGFVTIHSIYALFIGLFAFTSQVNENERIATQRTLDFQRQLWKQQKAQYEMTKENIEIINRKCHDLKHQVAALRLLEKSKDREAVIDSLEEAVMIYDSTYNTGNEVLDTVLTEKALICSQSHIALSCIANGSLLSNMNAVDIYTLFGNALDNAIEASMKVSEEERMIDVHVHEKIGLKMITISNACTGISLVEGKLPSTSKVDKEYHGYGLSSIQSIVEKYDGAFSIEAKNNLFTLRATFET